MRLPAPLLRRNPRAYKNQYGHVLVIAGSSRMLGAAALCGLSAYRTGAGLVTIGVPQSLNTALQAKISNEIMTLPLKEKNGCVAWGAYSQIKEMFLRCQSIAVGPGLGQMPGVRKLVLKLIADCPLPLVIDADALNILAGHLDVLAKARGSRILTPHPGEMARLTGLSVKAIEAQRKNLAQEFSRQHQCVLVLKGHRTVVASPDGKVYINKTGNSGMATAGCGDVLTGMITALIAQGIDPFISARLACFWHGLAGDEAFKKFGRVSLMGGDIVNFIADSIICS